MMYSSILDVGTLAEVMDASPMKDMSREAVARCVVGVLVDMSGGDDESWYMDLPGGKFCWKAMVGELAERVGGELSDRAVGAVVKDLGLYKKRCGEGFYVFWNREQLDLLMGALGMDEVRFQVTAADESIVAESGG